MAKTLVLTILSVLAAGVGWARGDAQPPTLFDPARHMHVSEVKAGMKGYGLTVFSGTKIDRFDVEVVDVVKNFNPKHDAILIRCPQEFLKNTGPIEGMSGSPIYLYDNAGRARLAGAFAYGWPLEKDCLAGVQPIEYMLELSTSQSQAGPAVKNPAALHASPQSARPRWSLDVEGFASTQVPLRPWGHRAMGENAGNRPGLGGAGMNMRALATPLMVGGINAQTLSRIAPLFAGSGLAPMQAGGGSGSASGDAKPALEPGSVLAVPLLTGDMELTAVGTCTEKIGDRIFGFGHSFNNEGRIELPMGSGSVAAIVANLETSFKLGFISGTSGALFTDQTVGVAGRIGQSAPMAPVELRVVYDDGTLDETYHFSAALHPKLTPLIAAAAVTMALTGEKNLPEYHTVSYDLTADFADGHRVQVNNSSVNGDGSEIVAEVALPLMAAADNPFAYVPISRIQGTFHVSGEAHAAEILSVTIPRTKYEPGETVKGYVSYLPFHAEEAILPVEVDLPRDLPDGQYQLVVSDWARYLEDERTANPFKFNAETIGELFAVIRDVEAIRHDSVFLRLVRQADGIAVGHTEMPHLPSSQRQVLLDSGRSDIMPFVGSTVTRVPAGLVMSGSAEFAITIERRGKVQTPTTMK
ncbi:MAG: hypothetical protein ABSB42_23080 [Tepidisphaeraceae bacterium]|jgi:hypothetical protein